MKLPKLTETTDILLTLFGLTFIVFGWFALSLALGGLFLFPLLALGFTLSATLALFILARLVKRSPLELKAVFLVAFLYAAIIGTIAEPTLFSGRDQGSIAEAAYRLAQNTELAFSTPGSNAFYQIYGEGAALNFPGFAYTKGGYLLTQFPLGYTAWLASFVSLFGLNGYAIANSVLLFLFLVFLYQLIRLFAAPAYASVGLLLALTSFLPGWFTKLTLTENLAVFLFVFLTYNLILFFREKKFIFYAGILLSSGLFAFTRIEGFLFLLITLSLIAFHQHTRSLIRTYPWKSIVLPALLFTFFFFRDFFINLPYYKVIGKALLKFFGRLSDGTLTAVPAQSGSLGSVLFLYGFLPLALLGFFGFLLFLKRKQYILLLPALIVFPTLLYFFMPNVTPDYPWMLRRYLFTLFPLFVFAATLCIALLFSKKQPVYPLTMPRGRHLILPSLLFLGLIILQLPAWWSQLTYAENRGLREQIASFSQFFSDRDLILVDQNATGNGFAMLTGPGQYLFGKNTVYFFNPYDLAALDTSPFDHVYLLTPEESQGRYIAAFGNRLAFKKSVTFTLNQYENISLSRSANRLPQQETLSTTNILFQVY